jgi:hypothetical protein
MSSPSTFKIEVTELRNAEHVYSLDVRWFTTIKDVKDLLHRITNTLPCRQFLLHSSCPTPLRNQITLHDLGIDGPGHSLNLVVCDESRSYSFSPVEDIVMDCSSINMVKIVNKGLERKQVPTKTDILDCTGGVYFMKSTQGAKIAVFKPQDEEQGMPNNYKGYHGAGELALRPNFKPGQGYLREFAVYLMDEGGFSRVPATTLARCEHPVFNYPRVKGKTGPMYPKIGSLQAFVPSSEAFEDIGQSLLSDLEVQRIALLDLRVLNADRNASNILVSRRRERHDSIDCSMSESSECPPSSSSEGCTSGEETFCFHDEDDYHQHEPSLYELHPIDHGYCLPSKLLINEWDWAWYWTPQADAPVHPEVKEYIASLDIESIIEKLTAQVAVSKECLFLLRVAHFVTQEGVQRGLSLREIASLIARLDEDIASPLERILAEAEENAYRVIEARSDNSRPGSYKLTARKSANTKRHSYEKSSGHATPSSSSLTSSASPLAYPGYPAMSVAASSSSIRTEIPNFDAAKMRATSDMTNPISSVSSLSADEFPSTCGSRHGSNASILFAGTGCGPLIDTPKSLSLTEKEACSSDLEDAVAMPEAVPESPNNTAMYEERSTAGTGAEEADDLNLSHLSDASATQLLREKADTYNSMKGSRKGPDSNLLALNESFSFKRIKSLPTPHTSSWEARSLDEHDDGEDHQTCVARMSPVPETQTSEDLVRKQLPSPAALPRRACGDVGEKLMRTTSILGPEAGESFPLMSFAAPAVPGTPSSSSTAEMGDRTEKRLRTLTHQRSDESMKACIGGRSLVRQVDSDSNLVRLGMLESAKGGMHSGDDETELEATSGEGSDAETREADAEGSVLHVGREMRLASAPVAYTLAHPPQASPSAMFLDCTDVSPVSKAFPPIVGGKDMTLHGGKLMGNPLVRTTSFTGFQTRSPSLLYEGSHDHALSTPTGAGTGTGTGFGTKDRDVVKPTRITRQRSDRRQCIALTEEFERLRLRFALTAVSTVITQHLKHRN